MILKLYRYRQYIWRNAWNDLRYQYAGTGMGVFWNIIHPLLQILVYGFVLSRLKALRSGESDMLYVLYLCTGLFPWHAFSEAIARGSNELLANSVYLRRLAISPEIFVAKNALTSVINLLILLLLLIPFSLFLGEPLSWSLLLLLPLAVLLQLLAFGLSLALASLRVFFRDIGEILRILILIWMWTIPVLYQETLLPENARFLFGLNPPYPFIRSIRNVFLEQQGPSLETWLVMAGWLSLFVLIGTLIMQKLQVEIRDVL
jgi:lipopolysaccharide transport system permease protein